MKKLLIQLLGSQYPVVYHNDKDIFIKQFNESKKKDDLSDSYLQGIYYICK